jgi:hypothetical protein
MKEDKSPAELKRGTGRALDVRTATEWAEALAADQNAVA